MVTDPNVPDSKCHVFEWGDHINCIHDSKVIQKNKLTEYIDGEKEKIKKLREKRDDKKNKTTKQKIIDELNQKVEELKPYIEERSKVVKSISKNVMCAQRYYRFLKEPKGVMPTILQNLLDARKNTRKIIKENNSMIKNIDDETKISDLTMLNNVLDKRQWAYKISANSVAGPTPIPCRIDGEFTYKTIEEVSKGNWKRINEEQEVSEPIDNLEVWSDMGFTKVKYVMRHPKTEDLYRVNTHTGCVDCTGDHSLLRKNGEEVKPKELKIGDELLHYDFPLPFDTPLSPLYTNLSDKDIHNYELKSPDEEIAFIHGMFFAEGTCGTWGERCKEKSSWIIYNQDLLKLERCKNILLKIETDFYFEITKYYESSSVYHLKASGNVIDIVMKYRKMFYDDRKLKKFPEYIFNAPFRIRQSFFVGYYNGDGNRNLEKGIVISNKGRRGCASLYYLARSLGYNVSISYSKDKNADFTFRLQCCEIFRIRETDKIKVLEQITQEEPNFKEKLIRDKIINGEYIEYENNKSSYRNITIHTQRYPKQKLIDSIDKLIICAEQRYSYITDYYSNTKKVLYKKFCCGKETIISSRTLQENRNEKFICDCDKSIPFNSKNQKNIYVVPEYIEYVYDLETENHHFAAGVGNMIVHNSMYGAMGVRRGYLPFMAGAMATTFMGRTNIEIVAKTIPEKYGGELVYGDQLVSVMYN